ncbi:hypothetical protein H9P43_009837 [Blastocladiella emersonii ATCC 22665]|nr:hypothetical protein H9P43_009837 [Blastocladiella emersonii ATCC 22665]
MPPFAARRIRFLAFIDPDFRFDDEKVEAAYWARAEQRYVQYLSLMEHTLVEGHALPLPPLDVLMMWLVHVKDSHRYSEDLVRVFGDIKLLHFVFPLDEVNAYLQATGAPVSSSGATISDASWQDFVPASHAQSWTQFSGQAFVLDAEQVAAPWTLACPFCHHDQAWESELYSEMRTGSRMLFCESCDKWITLPTVSAWRLVEDLRKAEKGQGHVAGTLLNFAKGKIDYKLAHSVHKLLFFTHEKSLTEILEARLNERDVVNPWSELDLAAILHDYVQAAVDKEYSGKAKELRRKADIVTGKILSYYQNVMTPLSLDLIVARNNWAKLSRDIADHVEGGDGSVAFDNVAAQTVIDRYAKFMQLLEERRKASLKDSERYKNLVPAIDILLAHRCHLLDPLAYKKYCAYKFGKIMDFSRFTCKAELIAEYQDMAVLWSQKYTTPFDLPFKKKKKSKGIKKLVGMFFGGSK